MTQTAQRTHIINVLSQLSSTGEVDVTVNMEKVLSKHNGPKDLNSLVGKYLYITVLLQEDTGTHTSTVSDLRFKDDSDQI